MIKLTCMGTPGRPKRTHLNNLELETIRMLATGKRPKDIAAARRCSKEAVSQWLKSARKVTKAQTNYELIAYAVREGIVQ